jgi:hypothetical protein
MRRASADRRDGRRAVDLPADGDVDGGHRARHGRADVVLRLHRLDLAMTPPSCTRSPTFTRMSTTSTDPRRSRTPSSRRRRARARSPPFAPAAPAPAPACRRRAGRAAPPAAERLQRDRERPRLPPSWTPCTRRERAASRRRRRPPGVGGRAGLPSPRFASAAGRLQRDVDLRGCPSAAGCPRSSPSSCRARWRTGPGTRSRR